MSKHKGFTLVEVALFIALTGVLFAGIVLATNNSIAEQRFFDSTQSFAEFLRSVYSQVSNPQSIGRGDSEAYAIYGKMISFGQCLDLDGETRLCDASDKPVVQKVFVYDVVGNVRGTGTGLAAEMLRGIGANVAIITKNAQGDEKAELAGIVESYEPRWGATIETSGTNWPNNLYKGTILVVRHPVSGTINTLVSPVTIDVNDIVLNRSVNEAQTMLTNVFDAEDERQRFTNAEVNFCVNPEGFAAEAPLRWNVRLIDNARNASGVEVIDRDDFLDTVEDGDDSYNKCGR
ncbi:prepilin-type N-terminal cleavage/methylation domain-containing protein [Candidatus Saccharibacteria bacterium]|nr:prepilin-type N-terminal cleavage/methylation domain-containing protein [Candidatus Saccharibacteria bacterium]